MHDLLKQQLERLQGTLGTIPKAWHPFLQAVSETYQAADRVQDELTHSLKASSQELLEQNERLQAELAERERAEKQLRTYVAQQAAIAHLGQCALEATDLSTLLQEATSLLTQTLDVDYGIILQLLPHTETFSVRAVTGWPEDLLEGSTFEATPDTPAGFTLLNDVPIIVEDFNTETRFLWSNLLSQHNIRSGLSLLIKDEQGPWGILGIHSTEPRSFSEDDLNFVQAIAHFLTQGIERAKANAALRESEERHRTLLQHLPVGIYRTSPDGRFLEANPSIASLLGVESPGALETYNVRDFYLDPSDRKKYNERLAADTTNVAEFAIRRPDGEIIWVRDYPRAVMDETGDIAYYDGILIDITERRKATEALRRSEHKYRDLFERANLPIFIFRPENEIVLEANQRACRTYGYDYDELIGMSFKALTADVGRGEQEIHRILSQGGTQNFETIHLTKTGNALHMLVSCSVIDYEGEVAVLCFARNVTKRKRAEALLQESEARFRAVVEHASDVIIILDEGANILYASPAVTTVLGYRGRHMLQQSALPFIHPADLPDILRTLKKGLAQPHKELTFAFRVRHRDGSWRHAAACGKNLMDQPGIGGLLIVMRDVTEVKRFEAELIAARDQAEEVARLKSTFLANMSHEIRTPLTAIIGFADILADEAEDTQQEFIRPIQEGSRRLFETLNSVLDLARIEAGGIDLVLKPVCVRTSLREAARLFSHVAKNKGLAFVLDLPDYPVAIQADRPALGRVLNNLISNAIKFTDAGTVSVSTRIEDETVYIDVMDTGLGIDDLFVPYLFEAFKQASTGLARRHEGSGLGLTITNRLVELMKGEIAVESTAGAGSRFSLSFPSFMPFRRPHPAPPTTPFTHLLQGS